MKNILAILFLVFLVCINCAKLFAGQVIDLNGCVESTFGNTLSVRINANDDIVYLQGTQDAKGSYMESQFQIKTIQDQRTDQTLLVSTLSVPLTRLIHFPGGPQNPEVYFAGNHVYVDLQIDTRTKVLILDFNIPYHPNNNIRRLLKKHFLTEVGKVQTSRFQCRTIIVKNFDKPKGPYNPEDDYKIVPAASGTGFFVSKSGHIITNHHVVDSCNPVKLHFQGKALRADVLAVDKGNDLAIIKAGVTPAKVYAVSNEDGPLLEDVIVAGYPLGHSVSTSIKTSKGSITSLAGYENNYSNFQTDAAMNPGNSGGPIINQKGNVVGVAVMVYGKKAGVEGFNFGIKSSTLKTFAIANGIRFLPPSNREMSNSELGELITKATVYLECWMSIGQIRKLVSNGESKKAFFSKYNSK